MSKFMGNYTVATIDGRGEHKTIARFDGMADAFDYCEHYAGQMTRNNHGLTALGCGDEGLIQAVIVHRTRAKHKIALTTWRTAQAAAKETA